MCIDAYCDASFKESTRQCSLATVIKQNGDVIEKIYTTNSCKHNVEGEAMAFLQTINALLKKQYTSEKINLYTDSKCVTDLIIYNIEIKNMINITNQELLYKYSLLRLKFKDNVNLKWISRKFNKEADRLAAGKIISQTHQNYTFNFKEIEYNNNIYKVPAKAENLLDINLINIPECLENPRRAKIDKAHEIYNIFGAFDKPIVVRKKRKDNSNNYLLVQGYNRYIAAQQLGIQHVPVSIILTK